MSWSVSVLSGELSGGVGWLLFLLVWSNGLRWEIVLALVVQCVGVDDSRVCGLPIISGGAIDNGGSWIVV